LNRIETELLPLRNQEYEIRNRALEAIITEKLLASEATKKNLSIEQLLRQEIESQISEPTNAEVEAFYLGQKDRINRPLHELSDQLRATLKQAHRQLAVQQYFESLRKKADVVVFLDPPRVLVAADPTRTKGNLQAPITVIEFADFQCPFCAHTQPVLTELLKKYDSRIKVSFRDFPLRQIHPQAQGAAEAGRCAAEQDSFWPYHDVLYGDQSKLQMNDLLESAKHIGLDAKRFEACLKSEKYSDAIEQDLNDGIRAGVTGTPAFFINGIFVSGAQPLEVFEQIIEAELSRQPIDR